MKTLLAIILLVTFMGCKKDDPEPVIPQPCKWECYSGYVLSKDIQIGVPDSSWFYFYVDTVKTIYSTTNITVNKQAKDTIGIRAILEPYGITYNYIYSKMPNHNTAMFYESKIGAPKSFISAEFIYKHPPTWIDPVKYRTETRNFKCYQ